MKHCCVWTRHVWPTDMLTFSEGALSMSFSLQSVFSLHIPAAPHPCSCCRYRQGTAFQCTTNIVLFLIITSMHVIGLSFCTAPAPHTHTPIYYDKSKIKITLHVSCFKTFILNTSIQFIFFNWIYLLTSTNIHMYEPLSLCDVLTNHF